MPVNFICDFCNTEEVDIVHSKGRQELVYPRSRTVGKILNRLSARFKYRGENCIKNGVNTTPDNFVIHSATQIKKWEKSNGEAQSIPSGSDEGLHPGGNEHLEKQA